MIAIALVRKLGSALIGRKVVTVPFGDWKGGEATVLDLGTDPKAPEIVMNVRSDTLGEIGVFWYEPIKLVAVDKT